MDVAFWAARVRGHIHDSGNRIYTEDEGGDEVSAWFPCPFCYVEIEVSLLCVHLRDEHCFDLKNAVCPICAANLGNDPLGHFIMQHAHSIKRRKKSQKSGFCNNNIETIKDFRESRSFLGANPLAGPGSTNEPASDPLLSPFLCNVPIAVPKDSQENVSSSGVALSHERSKQSPPEEVEEHDYQEKFQRAAFVQELIFSTIF